MGGRAMADALMGVFGYGPGRLVRVVELPLRTKGPNGGHEHWRTVHKRRKAERRMAAALCPRMALPCTVRLTRLSAGELDDDNLRGALKAVRDGCADALGVDDRDPRVRWEYGQARCKRGEFGVQVEVGEGLAQIGTQRAQEADPAAPGVSTHKRDRRPAQGHTCGNRGGAK